MSYNIGAESRAGTAQMAHRVVVVPSCMLTQHKKWAPCSCCATISACSDGTTPARMSCCVGRAKWPCIVVVVVAMASAAEGYVAGGGVAAVVAVLVVVLVVVAMVPSRWGPRCLAAGAPGGWPEFYCFRKFSLLRGSYAFHHTFVQRV
jgi:hypothetical protein